MASQNLEGDSYLVPDSRGNLPSVTLPMLIDYLADHKVLQQPEPARRTFH